MISISAYYRKWPGCIALSTFLFFLLLLGSCNPKGGSSDPESPATISPDTLPGDFVMFFDRFHEDSAYQMQHILFPLEGLPTSTGDGDTMTPTRYFWQKEEWKKHNTFTDPGRNFEQWFEVIDERIIEHWIQMNGTNLCMKRRFARLDDGWYLIYYQGLRPTTRR